VRTLANLLILIMGIRTTSRAVTATPTLAVPITPALRIRAAAIPVAAATENRRARLPLAAGFRRRTWYLSVFK